MSADEILHLVIGTLIVGAGIPIVFLLWHAAICTLFDSFEKDKTDDGDGPR